MIMSGHPFIKALAAYWGGAFVQGLRCHFISMPGKSPMKLEVTSRHDHSCLLGRKASKQTNKQSMRDLYTELQSDPATTDSKDLWSKFAVRLQQGIDKYIHIMKAGT